jgi:hypothetical protein
MGPEEPRPLRCRLGMVSAAEPAMKTVWYLTGCSWLRNNGLELAFGPCADVLKRRLSDKIISSGKKNKLPAVIAQQIR